ASAARFQLKQSSGSLRSPTRTSRLLRCEVAGGKTRPAITIAHVAGELTFSDGEFSSSEFAANVCFGMSWRAVAVVPCHEIHPASGIRAPRDNCVRIPRNHLRLAASRKPRMLLRKSGV